MKQFARVSVIHLKNKKSSIFNLDVKEVNLQRREFLIILKIPLFSKINLNEIKKGMHFYFQDD